MPKREGDMEVSDNKRKRRTEDPLIDGRECGTLREGSWTREEVLEALSVKRDAGRDMVKLCQDLIH